MARTVAVFSSATSGAATGSSAGNGASTSSSVVPNYSRSERLFEDDFRESVLLSPNNPIVFSNASLSPLVNNSQLNRTSQDSLTAARTSEIPSTQQSGAHENSAMRSAAERRDSAPQPPLVPPPSHRPFARIASIRDSLSSAVASMRVSSRDRLASGYAAPISATSAELLPFEVIASRIGYGELLHTPNSSGLHVAQGASLPQHSSLISSAAYYSDQIRRKHVYELRCFHCSQFLSRRAMKAILLANLKIELYSTNCPPESVQLVYLDYMTDNCRCKIRDIACSQCGNILGYHVTQPCVRCLDAKNNGHFWMFYAESVVSCFRLSLKNKEPLSWGTIDENEAAEALEYAQKNMYESFFIR